MLVMLLHPANARLLISLTLQPPISVGTTTSPEVVAAVSGAAEWFRKTRLEDGRWARFYDFKECRPFFCDRSGEPKRSIDEIDPKRKSGYSWFNKKGETVLKKFAKYRH